MTPGKICEPFCCRAPVALERWNLTLIVDGYCTATCPIEHVVLFQQCDVKGPALASKRLDMKCIKSRTCLLQVFPPFISFYIFLPVCHQAGQILMLSLSLTAWVCQGTVVLKGNHASAAARSARITRGLRIAGASAKSQTMPFQMQTSWHTLKTLVLLQEKSNYTATKDSRHVICSWLSSSLCKEKQHLYARFTALLGLPFKLHTHAHCKITTCYASLLGPLTGLTVCIR